jgi:predicted signal transduction protein with EAL and GGDEF domain
MTFVILWRARKMGSRGHLVVSLVKSTLRMLAGVIALIFNDWTLFVIGLVFAEFLGILEEILDNR